MLQTSAANSSPAAETLVSISRDAAANPLLTVLKGGFCTNDYSYEYEIRSDKTGTIIYSDCLSDCDEFSHEVDVGALAADIENLIEVETRFRKQSGDVFDDKDGIREEITREKLEETFWDEINQTLEDPFFRSVYDDGEWGEELRCERGTVEELTEFLELCLLTEREIKDAEDYLIVEAETECEAAGIGEGSYWSERMGELVEIACEYFKPSGHRYDYNDGCYDRYSGYSLECESICIQLQKAVRAPAREKMLGMIRLRQRLSKMDVPVERIKRLINF